nr:hypothetical protein [uncultured Halomonas sp.]
MELANAVEQQFSGFGWNTDIFADLLLDSSGGRLHRFFSDSSGSRGELRDLPGLRIENNDDNDAIEFSSENPLGKRLENISGIFSLNRLQLARACRVTRPTLYSWLHGVEPRRDALQRIAALHRAALDWQRSGFPQPEAALQLPLLKGCSMLDLLTVETLDLDAIHFLGTRLKLNETIESTEKLEDPFR